MQWSKKLYLFTKIYPWILSGKKQSGYNSPYNVPHLRNTKDKGTVWKTTDENVNIGRYRTGLEGLSFFSSVMA